MDRPECLVNTSPLVLPIRGNPVTVDGLGQARGIGVTLGDPSQFFSMKPALNQNNTFLQNDSRCGSANYSCIAQNGGVYHVPDNVMRTNSLNAWNGTQGIDVNTGANVYFNDRMTLQGRTIYGLPFYISQLDASDNTIQPGLALGENSSFLSTAIDAAVIPSKQWSYWGGDQNIDEDGHVIIGGYDKNRIGSDFSTFDMTRGKQVRLEITSLVWTDQRGNATSLLVGSNFNTLSATLEPFTDFLELPNDIVVDFVSATNGTIDSDTSLYSYTSIPSGSLTVTLSTGLVVTIPSQKLFDRGISYDSQGNYNNETYDFFIPKLVISNTYPDFTLFFGSPFLSQQYLVTDFDDQRFYLADAVSGAGSSVAVEPLCTGGPNPAPPSKPKRTNVAAIAGGVGGGVGGLIILLLILLFFIRHRRRSRKDDSTQHPEIPPDDVKPSQPPPKYPSGVPVIAEKDGVPSVGYGSSEAGNATTKDIGELPSPNTEFTPGSPTSRSSQGFSSHQQESVDAYYEMPSERY